MAKAVRVKKLKLNFEPSPLEKAELDVREISSKKGFKDMSDEEKDKVLYLLATRAGILPFDES